MVLSLNQPERPHNAHRAPARVNESKCITSNFGSCRLKYIIVMDRRIYKSTLYISIVVQMLKIQHRKIVAVEQIFKIRQ